MKRDWSEAGPGGRRVELPSFCRLQLGHEERSPDVRRGSGGNVDRGRTQAARGREGLRAEPRSVARARQLNMNASARTDAARDSAAPPRSVPARAHADS